MYVCLLFLLTYYIVSLHDAAHCFYRNEEKTVGGIFSLFDEQLFWKHDFDLLPAWYCRIIRVYQFHSLLYSPCILSPDTWWTVSWWCDDGDIMGGMTPGVCSQNVISVVHNQQSHRAWPLTLWPRAGCWLYLVKLWGWRRMEAGYSQSEATTEGCGPIGGRERFGSRICCALPSLTTHPLLTLGLSGGSNLEEGTSFLFLSFSSFSRWYESEANCKHS